MINARRIRRRRPIGARELRRPLPVHGTRVHGTEVHGTVRKPDTPDEILDMVTGPFERTRG